MTRQDLTYNAWLAFAGQKRAYTCEGIGARGCDVERVGHFYNDEHASAHGWDVSGLPVCPDCCASWGYDFEGSLDASSDYPDFLSRSSVNW